MSRFLIIRQWAQAMRLIVSLSIMATLMLKAPFGASLWRSLLRGQAIWFSNSTMSTTPSPNAILWLRTYSLDRCILIRRVSWLSRIITLRIMQSCSSRNRGGRGKELLKWRDLLGIVKGKLFIIYSENGMKNYPV